MRVVTSKGRSEKVDEGGDGWIVAALLLGLFLRDVDDVPLFLRLDLDRAMVLDDVLDRGCLMKFKQQKQK